MAEIGIAWPSVAVKVRTLVAQASMALTVVTCDPVVGSRKSIDFVPTAGVVPVANSSMYVMSMPASGTV